MPQPESEIGAFAIRSRHTPPDVPDGSLRRWMHRYELDTFASGQVEIPALMIQYEDGRPEAAAA